MQILYYITGHGFGHAQRSAEVVRAMLARRPDLHVYIRTAAPAVIFDDLGPRAHYESVVIDRGCIEVDALTLDWPATLRQVSQLLGDRDQLIEREASFIRDYGIRLIAADIPFLAGEIAHATQVPCWAVGNFTWDWIYEPWAAGAGDLVAQVRRGYERMEGLLAIPFRHAMPQFNRVIDVPLIAGRPRISAERTLERMGLAPDEPRPRVLAAMRGGIAPATLERAAIESPDLLFIHWGAATGSTEAPNLLAVSPAAGVAFHDALQAVDVVVTKVGHGIITDCIATNVAILWPPRTGFREDEMLIRLAAPFLRQRQIDLADFHSGDWAAHLRTLLAQPEPAARLPQDGATVVADLLLQRA